VNLFDLHIHVYAPSAETAEALGLALGLPCVLCCEPNRCNGVEHAPLVLIVGWGRDGAAVCAAVRAQTHAPIVLIAENTSHRTVIQGLNAGADLVLSGETDLGELRARIRALLRRSQTPSPADAYRLLRFSMP
jgi:DNA-binding NarL/FixJ family response regulator